jgi:hypothetical protein
MEGGVYHGVRDTMRCKFDTFHSSIRDFPACKYETIHSGLQSGSSHNNRLITDGINRVQSLQNMDGHRSSLGS